MLKEASHLVSIGMTCAECFDHDCIDTNTSPLFLSNTALIWHQSHKIEKNTRKLVCKLIPLKCYLVNGYQKE